MHFKNPINRILIHLRLQMILKLIWMNPICPKTNFHFNQIRIKQSIMTLMTILICSQSKQREDGKKEQIKLTNIEKISLIHWNDPLFARSVYLIKETSAKDAEFCYKAKIVIKLVMFTTSQKKKPNKFQQ